MKYQDRITLTTNPTAKRLLEIMATKESNLALAADLTDANALVRLVQQVGDEICVLKTHVDILTNFSQEWVAELIALAQRHHFLIFEDRKFADIGHTVQLQYSQGVYKISDWADITNAHIVPGPGIIEGLRTVGLPKSRGLLLIGEMSSAGNLATGAYTAQAIRWAEEYSDFVIGFIGMRRLTDDPKFIVMTPGVSLDQQDDALKQQYVTPAAAIQAGSDVIIVGRGIYSASDPSAAAKSYRQAGWQAYLQTP